MEDDAQGPYDDQLGSPIDRHVGGRLRAQRLAHGLSLKTVALALGVPEASVTIWEEGRRRIPAPHLLAMSQLLSCPLTAFFEGFPIEIPFDEDLDRLDIDVNSLFSRYSDAKH